MFLFCDNLDVTRKIGFGFKLKTGDKNSI